MTHRLRYGRFGILHILEEKGRCQDELDARIYTKKLGLLEHIPLDRRKWTQRICVDDHPTLEIDLDSCGPQRIRMKALVFL